MVQLYHGDCLEIMQQLPEHSVDMVLCDLPYGITANRWDSVIPFDKLWESYKRICAPVSAICLFGGQPFSSALVMSNVKQFKHEWIWIKNRGSNFANTVREPMKEHEHILVFSFGKWIYNKQMQKRTGGGLERVNYTYNKEVRSNNYSKFARVITITNKELRVPSSWQRFNTEVGLHPTQKPVKLLEYLIRTYSNVGGVVLDNCMGSGSTGVACVNTGRDFIGIELEEKYFNIAKHRIDEAQREPRQISILDTESDAQ